MYEVIEDKFKDGNTSGTTPKALLLQIAIKAVNNTASYDGLVLTLLVFRAYLCMLELSPPMLTIS